MERVTLRAPEPLGQSHKVDAFDCGVATLNDWLKRRAAANQFSGASRTYVTADDGGQVAGYYALAAGALAVADAPGKLRRNMPDPIPMAMLGRLAVDRFHQGGGIGTALLQDAVLRVRQAADILGIRGIMVHALNAEARRFYLRYGFVAPEAESMTVVMPVRG